MTIYFEWWIYIIEYFTFSLSMNSIIYNFLLLTEKNMILWAVAKASSKK